MIYNTTLHLTAAVNDLAAEDTQAARRIWRPSRPTSPARPIDSGNRRRCCFSWRVSI